MSLCTVCIYIPTCLPLHAGSLRGSAGAAGAGMCVWLPRLSPRGCWCPVLWVAFESLHNPYLSMAAEVAVGFWVQLQLTSWPLAVTKEHFQVFLRAQGQCLLPPQQGTFWSPAPHRHLLLATAAFHAGMTAGEHLAACRSTFVRKREESAISSLWPSNKTNGLNTGYIR